MGQFCFPGVILILIKVFLFYFFSYLSQVSFGKGTERASILLAACSYARFCRSHLFVLFFNVVLPHYSPIRFYDKTVQVCTVLGNIQSSITFFQQHFMNMNFINDLFIFYFFRQSMKPLKLQTKVTIKQECCVLFRLGLLLVQTVLL